MLAEGNHYCEEVQLAVMMGLIVADIGWISHVPYVGFTAIIFSLVLQLHVLWLVLQGRCSSSVHHYVIPVWIIGNLFWMCGEYLWDDSVPAETFVLSHFATLDSVAKAKALWYPRTLVFGFAVMLLNSMSLSIFYMTKMAAFDASPVLYHDLYLFPWLLSDSCWVLVDCCRQDGGPVALFSVTCLLLGFCALGICGVAVHHRAKNHSWQEASIIATEFLWVLGNVEWFIADALHADSARWVRTATVVTMALGILLFLVGGFVRRRTCSRDDPEGADKMLQNHSCAPPSFRSTRV